MLDDIIAALPPSWLGRWQLFVAATAVFNTIQNFLTLKFTRRIYNKTNVTAIQARSFAAWTLTSAVIRFYAAYHIHEKPFYDMALFTYLIAFGHFSTEVFIYRTSNFFGPVLSSVAVATSTLIWMICQYDFYVRS